MPKNTLETTLQWKRFKKERPDDDQTVLVALEDDDSDDLAISLAFLGDDDHWRDAVSCDRVTGEVIYWAPLPAVPRL